MAQTQGDTVPYMVQAFDRIDRIICVHTYVATRNGHERDKTPFERYPSDTTRQRVSAINTHRRR